VPEEDAPVSLAPPDGTRDLLPPEALLRARVTARLAALYEGWGYLPVDPPALEVYDPEHPRAAQSFKLTEAGGQILALRADFTPAVARLVRGSGLASPLRLRYAGRLWQAAHPDIARTREFTQVGLELIGVSNARADAELIHLARESLRAVGLTPRVEVGAPGFVRALFDLAGVPRDRQDAVADAIDRKDPSTLRDLLAGLELPGSLRAALLAVPDLYGDLRVLAEAKRLAPWAAAQAELERLEAVLGEFEDSSDLLLDLGMARRLSYYTGITFRAYTFDFGQPLLGGGRYDGALLPYAAGFALGLERLLAALPPLEGATAPEVLSLDDAGARALRRGGVRVARALTSDPETARGDAASAGISFLLTPAGLEPLAGADPEAHMRLERLLREEA
jgi:ATP phosphoribosyltransferase regulatory subunit